MRVRLIYLTTKHSGAKARREETLEVQHLSVGRGTNNNVCLNDLAIALDHGAFELHGDGVHFESRGGNAALVNRAVTTSARVRPGDVVKLGPFELRVAEPGGVDLSLEVEKVEQRGAELDELLARSRLGGAGRIFNPRVASWALVIAIPIVLLTLPLSSGRSMRMWDVGEVARPHSFFATECETCHAVSFSAVRDVECLDCHPGQGAHAPATLVTATLEEMRCGSCHPEHRGRDHLAFLEEAGCVECHAELDAEAPETDVRSVSHFGDDHPQFRLMLTTGIDADDPTVRVRERVEWRPGLEERSGLKFNHLRHVGQAVPNPSTGVIENLRCDECHALAPGAKNFVEIDYETHCQRCHTITFDSRLPGRQAVHGDAVAMREEMKGLYSSLALRGDPIVPSGIRRRRPGASLSPEQTRETLRWVDKQVATATRQLMEGPKAACAECHTVVPGGSDGGLTVEPVHVAPVWYPRAKFTHLTHWRFDCKQCHADAAVFDSTLGADEPGAAPPPRPPWSRKGIYALADIRRLPEGVSASRAATDVLIPEISLCRECHTGAAGQPPEGATGREASSWLASDCVLCHPFHRPELGPMRAQAPGAGPMRAHATAPALEGAS